MINYSELLVWLIIISIITTMTFRAGDFLLEAARTVSSYDTAMIFPYHDLS